MKKIIIGDFSGIQGYLFSIQENKSATKRLKGRSLFIEMLLDNIKLNLINELKCEEYLSSGGKFILICTDFDESKFTNFKIDIEEKLFSQFYGELKIIFGLSDWDGNEGLDFKNALNQAYENIEINKRRTYENILIKDGKWNTDKFVFANDRGPDKVCKYTRDRLVDDEMTNRIKIEISQDFLGEREGISYEAGSDLLITKGISKGKLEKKEYLELLKGNIDYKENLNQITNRKNLMKGIPKDGEDIKTFEDLGGKSNKLACLKGDIDDLGKLFMFDIEENNYKEDYKKLSDKLEKFWKEKLYELIEGRDIYIVYAGGDDFLMIGKWDRIIDFYLVLQNEFTNYFKEEKINFSASINIFGVHDTFFTIVKNTEELLKKSKEGNKNQITIFGQVIDNNEFDKLFTEINNFIKEFDINNREKSIVSVGVLRSLLDIGKKIIIENSDKTFKNENNINFFEYGTWRAELFYNLGRNYRTKSGNDKKDDFREYFNIMLLENENITEKDGKILIIMMSYILYKMRD